MDVEHNKKVVRRLLDEVVGRGDMELVAELCAADVVNHDAAPGRQHGTENLRAVLEFSRTAQPDQSWVEQHIVGDGDLVVVYGRRQSTWQASSSGLGYDRRSRPRITHISCEVCGGAAA